MKKLNEIVSANDTAYWATLFLAVRQRHRSEPMRISRFKKSLVADGLQINTKDLYQLFKDFEQQGAGKITYSRTLPFEFNWSVNYIEFAQKALDEAKSVQKKINPALLIKRKEIRNGLQEPKAKEEATKTEEKSMTMTLPNGLKVTIHLGEKDDSSSVISGILKSLS